MKKIIALFVIASSFAHAGLPPASSKGNGEATYKTTFKTDYGTIPVTRTGTTVAIGTIPIAMGGTGNTSGTATTNANLTGPITSVGNATSIASQTGTGSKFVMDTSPTLITPNIGVASGTSLTTTGNIGVGASVSNTAIINSLGAPITSASGNTQYGLLMSPTIAGSTAMATLSSNWSRIATLAGSTATLTDAINYDAINISKNGSGAITNSTGLMLRDQTSATNNYGIQNAVSSGANKWGYYGSGTANNALAGNTRFGSVVAPTSTVDVTGTVAASTSVTSPEIIGGTGTTSTLTLKPTSGVGTTGSDIIFGVGNNGATEAMRILNDGKIGVGTGAPTARFESRYAISDPSVNPITNRGIVTPTFTINSAISPVGTYGQVYPTALSGATNTGTQSGLIADSRVISPTSLGTFSSMVGTSSVFGISAAGAGNVTNAYGLKISPYAEAGTIGNAYSIYLDSPKTGGVLGNEYGVYSASPTAKNYFAGSVGIGSSSINANALLDVQSTTKASMPFPRMTTTQKNAITSPTAGMVVYDTTIGEQSIYNGTAWQTINSGSSVNVTPGATGTTADFMFYFNNSGGACTIGPACNVNQIGSEVSSTLTVVGYGHYTATLSRTYSLIICTGNVASTATVGADLLPIGGTSLNTLTIKTFATSGSGAAVDSYGAIHCKGTY